MAQLYGKCFQLAKSKEVKMLLRRCKTVKNDTTLQEAHDCIFQVIKPFIQWFTKEKIPVCHACNFVNNSKEIFTIQLDLKLQLLAIDRENFIDKALDILRSLGVTDAKVLQTIKYLVHIYDKSEEISFEEVLKTKLGNTLMNCYLLMFDRYINDILDKPNNNFNTDFQKHKNDYVTWLHANGRKSAGVYLRFDSQVLILLNTRAEQLDILKYLQAFDTRTSYNSFDFLDYHIIKRYEQGKYKISITPSDPKKIYHQIKMTKWNTHANVLQSLNVVLQIFNKYDICTNMQCYLNRLGLRVLTIARRNNSVLQKLKNKAVYKYTFKGISFQINIRELRNIMRVNFKEYLIAPLFLLQKDDIDLLTSYAQGHQMYKWGLWIQQKGKDTLTGKSLNPKFLYVHHINGDHTDNSYQNLILISKRTYQLIHSDEFTANKRILKYRRLLKV